MKKSKKPTVLAANGEAAKTDLNCQHQLEKEAVSVANYCS